MSHGDEAHRRAPEPAGDSGARCDVLFAGRIFFDLVLAGFERMPRPGTEEWAGARVISPGGVATRAVAAARLGLSTVLAGAVGSDFFGEFLCRMLSAEDNLQLRIRRNEGSDTPLTVALSRADERTFLSHSDDVVPPACIGPSVGLQARVVQIGAWPGVPEWARTMRVDGAILFGEAALRPEENHAAQVLSALADLDVFTASAAEAMAFTRTTDPWSAARALAEHVPLVTITCGREGALAIDARTDDTAQICGIAVDAVDPTGAGDVFTAAFIYALLTDLSLQEKTHAGQCCRGPIRTKSRRRGQRPALAGHRRMGRPPGIARMALVGSHSPTPPPGRHARSQRARRDRQAVTDPLDIPYSLKPEAIDAFAHQRFLKHDRGQPWRNTRYTDESDSGHRSYG